MRLTIGLMTINAASLVYFLIPFLSVTAQLICFLIRKKYIAVIPFAVCIFIVLRIVDEIQNGPMEPYEPDIIMLFAYAGIMIVLALMIFRWFKGSLKSGL